MDAETLQRLMLDRALGALPSDCETLLDAYLASRPEAAALSRELDAAVDLARKTLERGPAVVLPKFPMNRLAVAQRQRRVATFARRVTGLAAALLIGFGVHALIYRPTSPPPQPAAPLTIATAEPLRSAEPVRDGGFWSVRRLYQRAASSPDAPQQSLIWTSPITAPRPGGAT